MPYTYSDDDFTYNVADLIASAQRHTSFSIPTSELITYLEDDRWGGCLPVALLAKKHESCCAEHENRILQADLLCPIIFAPNHELIDGLHRIIKAGRNGDPIVTAVRLTRMPPPVSRIQKTNKIESEKYTRIANVFRHIWNTNIPKSVSVDLACLAATKKRVARVVNWGEGVGELKLSLERCGLAVRTAHGALYFGFCESEVEKLILVDNCTRPHVFRLGGLLSYPSCCCLKASEIGEEKLDEWQEKISVACDNQYSEVSPGGYVQGRAYLSHIPCHSTCLASLDIAKKVGVFFQHVGLPM